MNNIDSQLDATVTAY